MDKSFEDGFMKTAGIIAKGLKKAKRAVQSMSTNPMVDPSTKIKVLRAQRRNMKVDRGFANLKKKRKARLAGSGPKLPQ